MVAVMDLCSEIVKKKCTMRVAFYLPHKGLGGVNCSSILESNPGVGGTTYMFLVISTLLGMRKDKFSVSLFVEEPFNGLKVDMQIVNGVQEAIAKAENDNFDVLILKHDSEYVKNKILSFHNNKLTVFIWTHNFTNRIELDYYNSITNIKRIVCVGREHRDIYLDHPCISKMCFIYNTLNTDLSYIEKVKKHPFEKRKRIVTHVGSIVPGKNFHRLAAIWKDVVKEVPDAELNVIGSGLVYDRSKKMGRFGIAEREYEDLFMPNLMDGDDIMSSVHFLGSMGKEKEEILLETKVGVPNPWGEVYGETFCIVAAEMQLCGCTVVGGSCPGYYDTFFNGKIVKNKRLKDEIVKQLLSEKPVLDYDTTYSCIVENFSNESVVSEWEKLLLSDYNKPLQIPNDFKNLLYRYKCIKYALAYLKQLCPVCKTLLPFDNVLQKLAYNKEV